MIDQLIKWVVGGAIAYIVADKATETITGKHIHQHVAAFIRSLRQQAGEWLSAHPDFERVYINMACVADNAVCAAQRGLKSIKTLVWGQQGNGTKVIAYEEDIPIEMIPEMRDRSDNSDILELAA